MVVKHYVSQKNMNQSSPKNIQSRLNSSTSNRKEVKEKKKCMMPRTYSFSTDERRSGESSTFEVDLAKVATDSKFHDWDPLSLYQINKIATYFDKEKCIMVYFLCLHLSKVNQ